MDNLILTQIPLSELLEQFRAVCREEIQAANKLQATERLLSPGEACKLFQPNITKPTIEKLCRDGKLTKRFIGSRVFFKYSDLMDCIKTYKRYEQ